MIFLKKSSLKYGPKIFRLFLETFLVRLLVQSSGSKLFGPLIKIFVRRFLVRPRSYFLVENYLFLPTVRISGPNVLVQSGPVHGPKFEIGFQTLLIWSSSIQIFFPKKVLSNRTSYSPTELICIWSGSYFSKLDFRTKIVTDRFI